MNKQLLQHTMELCASYVESIATRPVASAVTPDELRSALGGALPENIEAPLDVIQSLARKAAPGRKKPISAAAKTALVHILIHRSFAYRSNIGFQLDGA